MIERLSLNSLKFFYYVARYQSVTEAAEKLFVTQSAVSKQLKSLEDSLGIEIFFREGRMLKLTQDGEVLFECCQQIFPQIETCLVHLKEKNKTKKNLILSCEPTIAMKWLIPRLANFKQKFPDIEVSLLAGGGEVDFNVQQIDLALRRDDFIWSNQIYSEKIADEYMLCVKKKDRLDIPKNIFISASRAKLWHHFKKIHHQQLSSMHTERLEHFYLCIEAALAGLGATIVSGYMVEREMDYQMLERLTNVYQDGSAYYLLSELPFEDDIRKMHFKNWLIDEMRSSQFKFSRYN